jgi:hypothetical protein
MKQLPYNTGKVLIGCRYEPVKRVEFSRDAERLQTALIGRPKREVTPGYCLSLAAICAALVVVVLWVAR